jgi:hypothetical protein
MNKFEQLIEYVINDEDAKARELFHDIVVEKSREIYENLMQEEEVIDEEKKDDEDDDTKVDEAKHDDDDNDDEKVEEGMGGDAADDLIDDVEMEEESDINMEDDDEEEVDMDMGDDMGNDSDMGGEEELEGRVMDLEDKLEELMAEFEELMGDDAGMGDDMGDDMGDGDDFDMAAGGDAIAVDDTEEMMPEMGMRPMGEAVNLKAAPSPVTSEEGGINKKSTVAANAGAKGPIGSSVKPVHAGGEMGGSHDTAAYKNTTKELIGKVGNSPAQGTQEPKPATKPQLGQASGVNTKSPLPGRR